jgi:ketosteroid isomerase-like protein
MGSELALTPIMKTFTLAAALMLLAATDPHADIEAANRHFIAALQAGQMADIASDYEDTGEFVSVRADVVGRKNLERFFANRKSAGKFYSGACTSAHLAVFGSTAIEQGGCSLTFVVSGQRKTSTGHYVTVWKYHPEASRWLIHTNVVPD